jgi:two-component sensor histidine kinase
MHQQFLRRSMPAQKTVIQFPTPCGVAWNGRDVEQPDVMTEKLQATLDRGAALRQEIGELKQRDDTLTQEFKCRVTNGLEMIALRLSSQSQSAATPETTRQLTSAARRVIAMGLSQGGPNSFNR